MATTPPDALRDELEQVTSHADALIAAAAASRAAEGPEAVRSALFAAASLIAEDHKAAAADLAVAWYEQLRDAAEVAKPFVPQPVDLVDPEALTTTVAVATESLYRLIQADIDARAAEYEQQLLDAIDASVANLQAELQKEIAAGFRDTIIDNAERDPEAVGWRRHTRATKSYASGCRWCRFLADKGAIYTAGTARFAAHKKCHCLASPVFDGEDGPKASVMQYVASKRKRTRAENAELRAVLDKKYGPDEQLAPAPWTPPKGARVATAADDNRIVRSKAPVPMHVTDQDIADLRGYRALTTSIPDETWTHILDGDRNGGAHRYNQPLPRNTPVKTWFPRHWTDQKIRDAVESVRKAPRLVTRPNVPGPFLAWGEVDGVRLVVVIAAGGKAKTAYPVDGDMVVKAKPRRGGGLSLVAMEYGAHGEVRF